MAFPTTFEIAGKYLQAYEAMYKEVDPNFRGIINASDAAGFLKRSNLGNVVLGQVWEVADQNKRGYLDKQGFFVALKLVAAVQHGMEPTPSNILADIPPPNFVTQADSPSVPMFGSREPEWIIKEKERAKYDEIFESLGPANGKLRGDQVKPVLLNSGLPADVLGKIWDLSDIDKDGYLDRDEMSVALHLVYRALENDPVPPQLPLPMIPPSKRTAAAMAAVGGRRSTLAGGVQVLPPHPANLRTRTSSMTSIENIPMVVGAAAVPNSPNMGTSRSLSGTPLPSLSIKPPAPWIVDKSKWELVFMESDKDHDGLVSGADVKNIFLQSGLSQVFLAHIWNLCDIKSSGTLNLEQFALAMHLIEQKRLYNLEPPSQLPPDLVPPSFRPSPAGMTDMGTSTAHDASSSSLLSGISGGDRPAPAPTGNKEIDRLQAEINEFQRESREFETQIIQLEADMTIKQSEIRNLDVELSTLESTVKQLERQKGEAQKRLDDLENQRTSVQKLVEELQQKVNAEEMEIRSMRMEVETTAASAKTQEEELNRKRLELQQLRDEEHRTDVKVQMQKTALQQLVQRETSAMQGYEKAQSVIDQVREKHPFLSSKLEKLEAMLNSGDFSSLDSDPSLLDAAVFDIDTSSLNSQRVVSTNGSKQITLQTASNPWNSTINERYSHRSFDASANTPQMAAAGATANAFPDPFQMSDPFAGHDPFTSSSHAADDPFGSSMGSMSSAPFSDSGGRTAFQPDPFTSPSATGGPWTAGGLSHALPQNPKRPPPRPAPPKSRPITPKDPLAGGSVDPFSSASPAGDPWGGNEGAVGGSTGFADFADFGKFS